jgi:hypothetical protein
MMIAERKLRSQATFMFVYESLQDTKDTQGNER